jgi:hypothetical protein
VSTSPAANFVTGTAGVVDTGGKFATGVIATGGYLKAKISWHCSFNLITKKVIEFTYTELG